MLGTLLLPSAPAPAATADPTIAHGDALGSWVFEPGSTDARTAVVRDAVSADDPPAVVGRAIDEVASNVRDVARTFSIPLALVAVILLYLLVQGRIDKDADLLTVDRPVGGDDDDAEFLL